METVRNKQLTAGLSAWRSRSSPSPGWVPWLGAATCTGILSPTGTKTTNKPEVVLVEGLQHPLSKSVRSRHRPWVHQGAHGEMNRAESQPWTGSSSQWGKFP